MTSARPQAGAVGTRISRRSHRRNPLRIRSYPGSPISTLRSSDHRATKRDWQAEQRIGEGLAEGPGPATGADQKSCSIFMICSEASPSSSKSMERLAGMDLRLEARARWISRTRAGGYSTR